MADENAVDFVKGLIADGKKVGVFSCEDPYNTPFHRDLLHASQGYLHLITKAGGIVLQDSVDLGLQAKGINAWGVFGHYGNVHGHDVCAAIRMLGSGYDNAGPHFKKHMDYLGKNFRYNQSISLEENIVEWVKRQYEFLCKIIPQKQQTISGAVQGNIIIFGGIVYNSEDGKAYTANVLFRNTV